METRYNDGRSTLEQVSDLEQQLKDKLADSTVDSVTVHKAKPGTIITMSDRQYIVDENGSFRRLAGKD